ncbi:epoxyqueuosine reductase [Hydrogenispora ethanolica]|uniref:Epoxyqueuosine reductase n=1 Tax=Hydrogenispora ethanolica TaxID=1082276 RepID=A0A4R1R2U3_HYDET|nr:4Fe-4S double cluster binding domain-containing protein [Hydrogenispora ethanolica]TCL59716.1 epoxyqueuosine reductase [Hydrogenispora ethanolica]
MIELLSQEILSHGDKSRILPLERLADLQKDIAEFEERQDLNGFQKWIAGSLYQFDSPAADFGSRSLLIIASPNPAYAKVIFHWQGQKVPLICLARSEMGKKAAPARTKQYLTRFLKPLGYHIQAAPRLPLKRLAVRSGLAAYGRNNICYVEGMGSFFTLVAYFSDIPCDAGDWHELRVMEHCQSCNACLKNCPTGAILPERFLIDNERCLSYFNESPGDFPDWLPRSVHHCLYDCLMCQRICPQNRERIDHVTGPVEFDEAETALLLSGKTLPEFPPALRRKVRFLGMDEWLGAMPRNIRVLLENHQSA